MSTSNGVMTRDYRPASNAAPPPPTIPANIQAETAVLGSCLINPDALSSIEALLQPSDFYRESNGWIYQAMLTLHARREPIDPVLLTEELERAGRLIELDGPGYLTGLIADTPTAFYAVYYATIVKEAAQRRHLLAVAGKIAELAYDESRPITDVFDQAEQSIMGAVSTDNKSGLVHIRGPVQRVIEKIDRLARDGGLMGVPSGFTVLDQVLGGFQRTDLIVLAARPGMGKCLGKGTKVLMYDGTLRSVEDVKIGDQVMGIDSTPRNVLSLARGREMMYWVHQQFGLSYRVNYSHILSLKRSKTEGKWRNGDVVNVPVSDVIRKGPGFFARHKGYKTAVDFPSRELPVDPYFLGVWLGDGTSSNARVTNQDQEVIDALSVVAEDRREHIISAPNTRSSTRSYLVTGGKTQTARDNSMQSALRRLGVLRNKHIPEQYLINSKENRLQLLAGLVDSDGHYFFTEAQHGPFEITLKNRRLASQVKFLCDTLGYRVSFSERWAQAQTGAGCVVYRIRFNGNVDEIPTKVLRKQAPPWRSPHNWRVSGITVEEDCIDDYYGFSIDGDQLFLLEDMTVTHNSSLAFSFAVNAAARHKARVAVFSLEMSEDQSVERWLSMLSGIDAHRLRLGKVGESEWPTLLEAANGLSNMQLFIDDTAANSITDIRSRARRIHAEFGLDLLLVDYMQLMSSAAKTENRHMEISKFSKGLKALAKELNIPIIALSQLSRGVESRSDKRPMLSDLRESGAIEEDADVVMFIYRDDYYHEDSARPNVADLIIAKHRHGATGTIGLFFQKELTKFCDLEITRTELNP